MRRLLAVLAIALPLVAHAQKPTPDQVVKAREVYEAGVNAYNAQFYADAEKAFREVYDQIHSAEVLFDIALSLEKQRKWGAAASVYDAYLRDSKKVKDRHRIEGRVTELRGRQQRQEDLDAALSAGKPPPAQVAAAPGNEVMKLGEVEDGLMGFGDATGLDAKHSDATVVTESPTPRDSGTATPIYKRWWLWAGVAAVVVIAAVVIIAVSVGGSSPATTSFPDIGPGAHAPLLRF